VATPLAFWLGEKKY